MAKLLDIALDNKKHDLLLINEDLLLIDNAERVAQQIKIQLSTFLGEWFLNKSHGVPYLERILVKNPNLIIVRQLLINQILLVDDVTKVENMTLDFNRKTRILTVDYTARTPYGLVTKKEILNYGN